MDAVCTLSMSVVSDVVVLELAIIPEIGSRGMHASLVRLRVG